MLGTDLVFSKVKYLQATTACQDPASDLTALGSELLPPKVGGQAEVGVLPQPLMPLLYICLCSIRLQTTRRKGNLDGLQMKCQKMSRL